MRFVIAGSGNMAGTYARVLDALPEAEGGEAIHDGATSMVVQETSGHRAIVQDFIDAVRDGRDPLVPGEDARRSTELILSIYKR